MNDNSKIRQTYESLSKQSDESLNQTEAELRLGAGTDGKLCLPALKGDSIHPFVEPYILKCQDLIHYINEVLQSDTTRHSVIRINGAVAKHEQEHTNDLEKQNNQMLKNEGELKEVRKGLNFLKNPVVHLLIFILGMYEGLSALGLFEDANFGQILAMFCSICFGLVMIILAHAAAKWMRKEDTIKKKKRIAIGFFLPVAGAFYLIANERTLHLAAADCIDCNHVYINPWLLFIMSVLSFAGSVIMAYFFLPSKEEQEKLSRFKQLRADLKKGENNISLINESRAKIVQESVDFTVASLSKIELGKSLENKIMTKGESLYKLYLNINRRNRPDGQTPDCFHDIFPFTWKTHFQYKNSKNINDNNNEDNYETSVV